MKFRENHIFIRLYPKHLCRSVANKSSWTYPKDVMYWEEWPVAQPFLLFAYQQYRQKEWLDTWVKLEHFPKTEEVVRNLPIRNPVIWLK